MAPKDVDTTVAHTATIHGYWMGGKDHFTASWEAAEQLLWTRPPADPWRPRQPRRPACHGRPLTAPHASGAADGATRPRRHVPAH
jgi:hypothetical protein